MIEAEEPGSNRSKMRNKRKKDKNEKRVKIEI
jgi:hypothetical protein